MATSLDPVNSHEIVIQTPRYDSHGVLHWIEFTTVWGLFKVREGPEQEVVIRLITGLNDKMRICTAGRTLQVLNWKPLGRNHLIIKCLEE